jgi:hypothetical protein
MCATLAVRRDRSVEARRAARQAKASRERRIIESLNRGVSVAVIADREDVTEKRMRALVRDILARRMPEPPAQFLAMQVSRLNEALLVSFGAMSGQPSGGRSRLEIVRELDRYHGFAAAERQRLPASRPEAPEQIPPCLEAHVAQRIRPQMAPQRLEKIESVIMVTRLSLPIRGSLIARPRLPSVASRQTARVRLFLSAKKSVVTVTRGRRGIG